MLRWVLRSAAAVLPAALALAHQDHHQVAPRQQRLGVLVPAYKGDLARTVSSLKRWPAECSPLTLENADLVLYYAQEESSATASALESISSTAGRCFSRTRIVYANLAQEDDIYPRGPSVMFYKMFLDEDVRSSLSEYDALSIIEWDVLVASDDSFEELYHAAFRVNEEFWVKGSNLEGTSFHSTAEASEMWQVLGHINGNAIYNNDDPAFVEYVEYTRSRWGYEHPYDVALWMTISDFPYSWPLYQRYSSKFVVTNLISSVGFEHVGHDTVSDAVAGQTLFIHGSSVEEGNVASFRAAAAAAVAFEEPQPAQQSSRKLTSVPKWKTAEKWKNGNDDGTPKWKSNQKWKNKNDGSEPKWRTNQKWKNRNDSSDDSSSSDAGSSCSSRCAYTSKDGTKGRVCDSNCSSPNIYGTKGCSAKQGIYGADCRVCYNNVDRALKQDSPDNRAIMCSTVMPVDVYRRRMSAADDSEAYRVARSLEALKEDASSPSEEMESGVKVDQDRKLTSVPKWKAKEKWRTANDDGIPKWQRNQKWKTKKDDGSEPKWRTNQKWKNRNDSSDDSSSSDPGCSSRCAYTSKDGTKGRVCDSNCSMPNVYGTKGCGAKQGIYGADCRVCYNNADRALKQDSPDNRAIMCSTVKPVDVYRRRMATADESEASRGARSLKALKQDASSPSEQVKSAVKVKRDRKLTSVPKWKAKEKWRTANDDGIPKWQRNQKWKTKKDDGSEPKWRTNQKWKNRNDSSDDSSSSDAGCSSRCTYTSKDGTKGRVCDSNCSMPNVYGTKGCNAKQGIYGADCRVCYNNVDRALKQDSPDNRAIMCSTVMPVDAYGRRMSAAEEGLPSFVARSLKALQEDASSLSWKASEGRELTSVPKWKAKEKWRTANDDGVPKWKSNQKWKTKKDDGSEPKWRTNQKWKNRNDSVDDSSSSDAACSSRCAYTSKDGTKGRVCDSNCSSPNVYGAKGCNAKQGIYGADCRVCYNNVDRALKQDSPDNRAIMCSTVKPVDVYRRRMSAADESEPAHVARSLAALKENASSSAEEAESAVKVNRDRELTSVPKWKAKEKWRTANDDGIPKWQRNQKWKTKKDDGSEPKWRTNQKWKNRNDSSDDSSSSDAACSSRCAYTSKDGTKGRVCDSNCSSPNVYGTKGCGAKQGIYGADCRVCYNNVDRALKQDSPDNRAIMCSTVMPVDVYGRRLSASDDSDPVRVAKMIEAEDAGDELSVDVDMKKAIRFFEEAAERPFSQDLKRHNLCAFAGGRVGEEAMWEVTVKSILQFMPGMRVAIAAEAEGLDAYKRSMGGLPGVTISSTQSPATAALFADQYCGAGTALILYVEPGSVLSRPFASKDTHSPRGDLLVVHTSSQGSYHDAQLRSRSASVLGFDAPSFTHGTDLMLPMGTNEALRESFGLRHGASLQHDGDGASLIALQELVGFDPVSALPQVLAALAYSRETPGVWFVDPQAWVGQNLFKEASIWDVPLVKPRYTCAIAPAQLEPGSPNTAEVLQSNLDFFSKGGKCANGLIGIMP